MNSISKVIVAVVVILAIIGFVVYVLPQLGSDELNLPNAQWVQYNQYSFRYMPASNHLSLSQQDELQVSPSNSYGATESFAVVQGASYTAFGMSITISEVHSDYLIVAVK